MPIYDIGIIGAGTAGTFALQKILNSHSKLSVAVFEAGRPPMKRRHQIFGFLGCLPGSDGKLYLNDLSSVASITGYRKADLAFKEVLRCFSEVVDMRLTKDKRPSLTAEKRLSKEGYDISLNHFYQLYPKDIHSYSRVVARQLDESKNTFTSFDNEVFKVLKHKQYFSILTSGGDFQCKKVLIAVGRGGWRWVSELFSNFGIIESNDTARYGIKIEMPSPQMKDFNESNCTLSHNLVEVGPFSWAGVPIPEDHLDFAQASFRSNETRWESDKVSANVLATKHFEDQGYQQNERIAKLAFILGNDRVMREKISTFMNRKSKISILPEYSWLLKELEDLDKVIPELINRGSFYAPVLLPFCPKIKVRKDFSTEVKDLYVAGESANCSGIVGASVSGCIVAEGLLK